MFECSSCTYKSDRKFNIRKHIQNVHKRDPTDEELTDSKITTENSKITTENSKITTAPEKKI